MSKAQGLGFTALGLGLRVLGSGLDLGIRVLGFRVLGCALPHKHVSPYSHLFEGKKEVFAGLVSFGAGLGNTIP